MEAERVQRRAEEKPFWLRPPWMILFNLVKLRRMRPWDVKVSYLLNTLLAEMRRQGYLDFTASGIALLSSATVYRMKTELILKLEEPPPPPKKVEDFIPPPIQLPFRYEYTSTTIKSLLQALEEAMKGVGDGKPAKPEPILPEPAILEQLDQFMIDIENKIDEMYGKVAELARKMEIIPFSKIVTGLKRIEVIRSLILLLFLACRGQINLWQKAEFGEIYVSLLR